ncbi:unnamed protein product [Brassica napus]|uniref:(rape) hypothetical protein n=1 Tax=Brassica napus TaxID=3708 RepID=A0A816JI39_BRANA|nr:unnamed protein product [Brassica napus]
MRVSLMTYCIISIIVGRCRELMTQKGVVGYVWGFKISNNCWLRRDIQSGRTLGATVGNWLCFFRKQQVEQKLSGVRRLR